MFFKPILNPSKGNKPDKFIHPKYDKNSHEPLTFVFWGEIWAFYWETYEIRFSVHYAYFIPKKNIVLRKILVSGIYLLTQLFEISQPACT